MIVSAEIPVLSSVSGRLDFPLAWPMLKSKMRHPYKRANNNPLPASANQHGDEADEEPAVPGLFDQDIDLDPADFVDPEDFRAGRRDGSFRGRFQ